MKKKENPTAWNITGSQKKAQINKNNSCNAFRCWLRSWKTNPTAASGGEAAQWVRLGGWDERADEGREQSSAIITAQPPTWTCSCYHKMGQSHDITRYFIIHPFILIMEWNVQLIAPKQSELALTCLRNHSHPPHTCFPPYSQNHPGLSQARKMN